MHSREATFRRHPAAGPRSSEFELEVSGAKLSGLLAEPSDPAHTRALLVALHGANMHAGYFDAQSARGLSLLDVGSQLGYTVWAPDRPGIGASGDLSDDRICLFPQAELLMDAIDEFSQRRSCGAGIILVGHSYGLKVALTMAASPRGQSLLGLDGSGSGIRYAFDWRPSSERKNDPTRPKIRPEEWTWGPRALYPEGTIRRESLPLYPFPPVQAAEGGRWPADIRGMAERITLPMRLTFAEHERLWPTDPAAFDELRSAFKNAKRLQIDIEPWAGHNISLGWAARAHHLKVLAFAESLCLDQMGLDQMGVEGTGLEQTG